MDKDKQIFQMHRDGYDKIAKAAAKGISINVNGANVKDVKLESPPGPPGEPGKDGKTPVKGVDYFTPKEVREIASDILSKIPKPKDGKDAIVDYPRILEFIRREVAKIKIPKPENGKDAVVDYSSIITSVLKQIPKSEVDYKKVQDFVDEAVKKVEVAPRVYRSLNSGGPTTRLEELVDVDLTDLTAGQVLSWNGTRWTAVEQTGGGGDVSSVNGQTGVVVLDADDIDDTSTTNKFVTASDITNLGNLSGTNTGDQDISGISTNASNLSTHIADTANPHSVTATQVGLGNVDNTSDSTKNSATVTLTNKRITPRVVTTADDSTAVIDIDVTDQYQLTAIANATTISITGTPTAGQKLIIRLEDNGTSKALTWDPIFRAIGVTLPIATTATKTHYIGCIYNATDVFFDVVAVAEQA